MALNHVTSLTFMAMVMMSSSAALASGDVLEVQQQGNVSFVSGGIGKDENDALRSAQHLYNFQMINADKSGHFSGDVQVKIRDAKKNVVLDTVGGPLLYANLPNGKYVVEALSNGQTITQNITIVSGKAVRKSFVWLSDANEANNLME